MFACMLGEEGYMIAAMCDPVAPPPVSSFPAPTEQSMYTRTTAALRAVVPGDGVQCRQKKLGCCFHSGGDNWELLGAAQHQMEADDRALWFGWWDGET